ncbi:hypothetical protein [Thermodesulfatator atlanticus]|uniref:hypothetical protein n=1 Tax=Thermodesulfatator atlanticus TaxID=501497 RepID=UPI0003B3FDCE|nr:hypothetical protein [Thermodesulfatator atlanticus]
MIGDQKVVEVLEVVEVVEVRISWRAFPFLGHASEAKQSHGTGGVFHAEGADFFCPFDGTSFFCHSSEGAILFCHSEGLGPEESTGRLMDPSPLAQDDRGEVSMTEGWLRLRMTREEWFCMTIPSVMLKEHKRLKHPQEYTATLKIRTPQKGRVKLK